MRRFALASLMLLVLVSSAFAQSRKEQRQMQREQRRMERNGWSQGWTEVVGSSTMLVAPPAATTPPVVVDGPPPVISDTKPVDKKNHAGSDDALDEVNAERASRGLRPFIKDPLLTQAALACAKERAARHIHGHLARDFDHLPPGGQASAAGCGALEDFWGWGTCCTYDSYTYAGAAWVRGSDGRRYMHLFVR